MSSESLPAPRRGRRYGWWIAAGLFAVLVALLSVAWLHVAGPVKFAYGLMSGDPQFPGCSTAVAREETVGPLWYRVVNVACPDESMHFVYAKRAPGPGWFVFPAFMSTGSPIPVLVRQTGDSAFEVVLEKPLADGRASVPVEFDQNGMFKIQAFEHGRPSEFKSPARG
jgi:hypothetical protein